MRQGSGLSAGEYVTLGALEVDDLAAVVDHLRSTGAVSTIGIWGRSMGAVTALMYSMRDPSIAGTVSARKATCHAGRVYTLCASQHARLVHCWHGPCMQGLHCHCSARHWDAAA